MQLVHFVHFVHLGTCAFVHSRAFVACKQNKQAKQANEGTYVVVVKEQRRKQALQANQFLGCAPQFVDRVSAKQLACQQSQFVSQSVSQQSVRSMVSPNRKNAIGKNRIEIERRQGDNNNNTNRDNNPCMTNQKRREK